MIMTRSCREPKTKWLGWMSFWWTNLWKSLAKTTMTTILRMTLLSQSCQLSVTMISFLTTYSPTARTDGLRDIWGFGANSYRRSRDTFSQEAVGSSSKWSQESLPSSALTPFTFSTRTLPWMAAPTRLSPVMSKWNGYVYSYNWCDRGVWRRSWWVMSRPLGLRISLVGMRLAGKSTQCGCTNIGML